MEALQNLKYQMLCKKKKKEKNTTSGNPKVSRGKEENSKSILKQHVINLLNIMVYIVGKELIAGRFYMAHIK